ncbi:TonB-dependent receptor domain-containing protein [Sphingopyxis sp. MWB1]|uniref:TonB-dependent receptor domain-containing protein n=1 Tax=Sphingopyxis sp. MWB1 TaxID=1537715 RepID=UPI00051A52D5|nr:TonB-dependent receptor [Sphingopyxis sp. MWB1]
MSKENFRRSATALLASASVIGSIAAAAPASAATSEVAEDVADNVDGKAKARTPRAHDIVVTGQSLASDTLSPLPVQLLTGDELVHRRQGGLGETLAGLPGVHLDNFGGGASRPVIRGQTMPRIEILTDGANLFDASSVSPDHAITTDPLLLDAIEIQRGPAAVRYGGNAVNGVVNLIDSKVPKVIPEGGLSGAAEARYGTGAREQALAGRVTAGTGMFAVHVEGAYHVADDYDVPNGYGSDRLQDSFAEGSTYSAGASLVTSRGYIGAAYTRQNSEYGLPGHSHRNAVCHTHGRDLHCAAHDQYDDPFGSSDDHTASIKLKSDRIDLRGDFADLLPGFSHLRLRGSYTDYRHDEIDGPALFSRYTNKVWDGRIELTHKPLLGFTGTFGMQYTDGTFSGLNVNNLHQKPGSTNSSGLYNNVIPPFYHVTENIGIFLSERRAFGPVEIELAARKDWREITLPTPEHYFTVAPHAEAAITAIYERLYGADWRNVMKANAIAAYHRNNPDAKHKPFSASLGATWNIGNGYSAALSLARTERAPNVRELYAYGNNLATNSYEVGLSQTRRASSTFPEKRTDVMETTKSVDLTLRKSGGPLEFEIGLFHQDIDEYIFAELIETDTETGVPANYLLYVAADARFQGVDGQISYHLDPTTRLTIFGDYVDAKLKSDDDNLPRIPPGRLGARLNYAEGPLSSDIEYYHSFAQDRFASYETRTAGYHMLNATIAYRFDLGEAKNVEFYLRGTNLMNELAYAHTSFVKNQSPLRGRSLAIGMRHQF